MILLSMGAHLAHADAKYLWIEKGAESGEQALDTRFPPPSGAKRVAVADGSFGAWLRTLPLLPAGTGVHLYDGSLKVRQDVHAAVIDLDVPKRDLQQCADAVMRLRAEYLFSKKEPIVFHPEPGKKTEIRWSGKSRADWPHFLERLFAEAGSASLQAEMAPVKMPQPGDVLIQGGYPGHAVIVLDAARTNEGQTYLLLGQSYMPAQQFHVLKNLGDTKLSPWFDAAALDSTGGLQTPEWKPFTRRDLRTWP
jgi:hypothetical protein